MRAAPGADMHSVLVALLAAFGGADDGARVQASDAPSGTALTVISGNYTIDIAVPRVAAFDAHVSVTVETHGGAEPLFTDAQAHALERAAAAVATDHVDTLSLQADLDVFDHNGRHIACRNPHHNETESARQTLSELGVEVLDAAQLDGDWDSIAGYDDVKRRIQDTLVLPLKHPDVFDRVVRATRRRFQSNVPKAVLYSGPPGCGKTMSARVLAASVGVPFVHVPLENLLSKYYGETTKKLAAVLDAANNLGQPCIVFIDEADALAMSRAGDVHEVSRRTLSVLLRFIDGVDGPRNAILLCATNCADDLDPALLSRFDAVIDFPLPDLHTRQSILGVYATQLSLDERRAVATLADGFSGRELLDACEDAERTHAGRVVRGAAHSDSLPTLQDYIDAVRAKIHMSVHSVDDRKKRKGGSHTRRHSAFAG